jgi:hypothetical protein
VLRRLPSDGEDAALEGLDVTLDDDDLEAIAARVAELLAGDRAARLREPVGLVDAREVARALGVKTSWVYAHKDELGAVTLGTGPRARLRFDLERATQLVRRGGVTSKAAERTSPGRPRRGRPRKARLPDGVELIRGRSGTDHTGP